MPHYSLRGPCAIHGDATLNVSLHVSTVASTAPFLTVLIDGVSFIGGAALDVALVENSSAMHAVMAGRDGRIPVNISLQNIVIYSSRSISTIRWLTLWSGRSMPANSTLFITNTTFRIDAVGGVSNLYATFMLLDGLTLHNGSKMVFMNVLFSVRHTRVTGAVDFILLRVTAPILISAMTNAIATPTTTPTPTSGSSTSLFAVASVNAVMASSTSSFVFGNVSQELQNVTATGGTIFAAMLFSDRCSLSLERGGGGGNASSLTVSSQGGSSVVPRFPLLLLDTPQLSCENVSAGGGSVLVFLQYHSRSATLNITNQGAVLGIIRPTITLTSVTGLTNVHASVFYARDASPVTVAGADTLLVIERPTLTLLRCTSTNGFTTAMAIFLTVSARLDVREQGTLAVTNMRTLLQNVDGGKVFSNVVYTSSSASVAVSSRAALHILNISITTAAVVVRTSVLSLRPFLIVNGNLTVSLEATVAMRRIRVAATDTTAQPLGPAGMQIQILAVEEDVSVTRGALVVVEDVCVSARGGSGTLAPWVLPPPRRPTLLLPKLLVDGESRLLVGATPCTGTQTATRSQPVTITVRHAHTPSKSFLVTLTATPTALSSDSPALSASTKSHVTPTASSSTNASPTTSGTSIVSPTRLLSATPTGSRLVSLSVYTPTPTESTRKTTITQTSSLGISYSVLSSAPTTTGTATIRQTGFGHTATFTEGTTPHTITTYRGPTTQTVTLMLVRNSTTPRNNGPHSVTLEEASATPTSTPTLHFPSSSTFTASTAPSEGPPIVKGATMSVEQTAPTPSATTTPSAPPRVRIDVVTALPPPLPDTALGGPAVASAVGALGAAFAAAAAVDLQAQGVLRASRCVRERTDTTSTERGGEGGGGAAYRVLSPIALHNSCQGVLQGNAILLGAGVLLSVIAVVAVRGYYYYFCHHKHYRCGPNLWLVAAARVRCPGLLYLLCVYLQSGALVCGAELATGPSAGIHNISTSSDSSSSRRTAGGVLALLQLLVVLAAGPVIAFLVGTRAYVPFDPPLVAVNAGSPLLATALCAAALPMGEVRPAADVIPSNHQATTHATTSSTRTTSGASHNDSTPHTKNPPSTPLPSGLACIGACVGAWRRPHPAWTAVPQLSVVALIPAVAASGVYCTALLNTSAALLGAAALFLLWARPRRVLLSDVLQAAALATNGATVAVTSLRIGSSGHYVSSVKTTVAADDPRTGGGGGEAMSTADLDQALAALGTVLSIITLLRIVHAATVALLCRFPLRRAREARIAAVATAVARATPAVLGDAGDDDDISNQNDTVSVCKNKTNNNQNQMIHPHPYPRDYWQYTGLVYRKEWSSIGGNPSLLRLWLFQRWCLFDCHHRHRTARNDSSGDGLTSPNDVPLLVAPRTLASDHDDDNTDNAALTAPLLLNSGSLLTSSSGMGDSDSDGGMGDSEGLCPSSPALDSSSSSSSLLFSAKAEERPDSGNASGERESNDDTESERGNHRGDPPPRVEAEVTPFLVRSSAALRHNPEASLWAAEGLDPYAPQRTTSPQKHHQQKQQTSLGSIHASTRAFPRHKKGMQQEEPYSL